MVQIIKISKLNKDFVGEDIWAISDELGHTIIQMLSKNKPTEKDLKPLLGDYKEI